MTSQELRDFLVQRQVQFEEKKVPHGLQFRCSGGEIFSVFKTGKLTIQGSRTDLTQAVEKWQGLNSSEAAAVPASAAIAEPSAEAAAGPSHQVFIVYGHDTASRDSLELLLRRMGLEPIVLQNLPAAGDTIIEKLERYLGEHGNIGFACVLLTPDDEGHKAGLQHEKKYRARQNVILELGMVLARLGRRRVAILHKESVELPSDIAGLIYIPFMERVDEVKTKLFQEIRGAGYSPRTEAL